MVNWEQIIPVTLEAGVIGFLLTTTLNEYNQPKIQAELVNMNETNPVSGGPGPRNMHFWDFLINIRNAGPVPATDVRSTFHFIYGNVTLHRIMPPSSENATFLKGIEPDELVVKSPRLSPYGSTYVYARVTDLKSPRFVNGSNTEVIYNGLLRKFNGQYIVSSSFKEGGSPYLISADLRSQETRDNLRLFTPLATITPFSNHIILIGVGVTIGIIAILVYLIKKKKSLDPRVQDIYKSLLYFDQYLKTKLDYRKKLPEIEWRDSYELFGTNANDILLIQNVLSKIKNRNQKIEELNLNDKVDQLEIELLNTECLAAVDSAIEITNWEKYKLPQGNSSLIAIILYLSFVGIGLLVVVRNLGIF